MNSTVLYLEKIIPFYSGLRSLVITMLFFLEYSSCPSLSGVLIYLGNFI